MITVNPLYKQTAQLTAKRMVKEWNTHPYPFDMPKTSNFMAKTNTKLNKSTTAEACDFQSPTTRFVTNVS